MHEADARRAGLSYEPRTDPHTDYSSGVTGDGRHTAVWGGSAMPRAPFDAIQPVLLARVRGRAGRAAAGGQHRAVVPDLLRDERRGMRVPGEDEAA